MEGEWLKWRDELGGYGYDLGERDGTLDLGNPVVKVVIFWKSFEGSPTAVS